MEQNQFEGLEEVEMAEVKEEKDVNTLKEYEKLLLFERDRADYEKAINLVKFGCFEQKELTELNYNNLEKLQIKKKYKGLYNLYRDLTTMQLLFVAELVENNKGDEEERKDLKPYGYDVIFIEAMDDETYQAVLHAGRNNVSTAPKRLLITSYVVACVNAVLAIFVFLAAFFTQESSSTPMAALLISFMYAGPLFAGIVLSIPLCTIANIHYNKYKDQ